MRVLIALLMLSSTAQAQELACPQRHPEAPRARLVGGGMYHGAEKQYELVGLYQKAHGGYNVQYGFAPADIKWLACSYEGRQAWWMRVDSLATDCKLESRGRRAVHVKLTCK